MPKNNSPLRYPGGKHHLLDLFKSILNRNDLLDCHFFEVFAGGAAISIGLLKAGFITKAYLVEKDPLVFSLWHSIKNRPEELCEKIRRKTISLESWKRTKKYLEVKSLVGQDKLELGVAGLFLNRTSFSGIIGAGPIGGMSQKSEYKVDCRFNKKLVESQVREVAKISNRFEVHFGDAIDYLKGRKIGKRSLVYLDPPYFEQGDRLYRHHFSEKDHKRLAKYVVSRKMKWIVSYDNHTEIKKMFASQKIVPITLNHVIKNKGRGEELLISNLKIVDATRFEKRAEKVRLAI